MAKTGVLHLESLPCYYAYGLTKTVVIKATLQNALTITENRAVTDRST